MRATKLLGCVALSLAVAGTALAQRGRHGAMSGSGPLVDASQVVVVEGTVVQLVAGLGQGIPELQVEDAAGTPYDFVLGPFWYLSEQGFAAAAGDLVTVTAYLCAVCDTGYAVASVVNHTNGLSLALRDADGAPLWPQRRGQDGAGGEGEHGLRAGRSVSATGGGNGGGNSGGNGGGNGGGHGGGNGGGNGGGSDGGNESGGHGAGVHEHLALDLSRTTTFAATVTSYAVTAGEGAATLVATTESGELSFFLSPVGVLLRSGFTAAPGDALVITAAPATVGDATVWLVLTIEDPGTGLVIVLRDPATGYPLVGRAHRGRS